MIVSREESLTRSDLSMYWHGIILINYRELWNREGRNGVNKGGKGRIEKVV